MAHTNIGEEYRTIEHGAGWISRRTRGRLRFDGRDAVSFLQSLLTNDVAGLACGQGLYCAYLTPQGRMVADLAVYHRGDWLLAEVPDRMGPSLAERFDALVFAEDVRVSDCSGAIDEIACIGGAAAAAVAAAFSLDRKALEGLAELSQIDLASGFVARSGDAQLPMYRIFAPASDMPGLITRLEARGAVVISEALADALRVEAGRPLFGADMTDDTIPLEAGLLDRAISTTKGCYVGQEIIIRILHRGGGRVARRLVTLVSDATAAVIPVGTSLEKDGREVGRVTSVARSPRTGETIALGYVTRDLAEVGLEVGIAGSRRATARVTGFAR